MSYTFIFKINIIFSKSVFCFIFREEARAVALSQDRTISVGGPVTVSKIKGQLSPDNTCQLCINDVLWL